MIRCNRRILLLLPHLVTPGGALTYTLKLAEELLSRGASVGIVTLRADEQKMTLPAGVELLSADGPLTSSLRYWLLFPLWQRRLEKLIRQWEPDCLVPQVFPANWWGWLYK